MIECFFDGAVAPFSPGGYGGYGMLIREDHQTIYSEAVYIGRWPSLSSNCAEYAGCISVLRYLLKQNITEARIYGDSMLVIKQLNSEWKAKAGAYLPYYQEAWALRVQIPNVKLEWIPREMNYAADDLSKIGVSKRIIGFTLDSSVEAAPPPTIKRKRKRTREVLRLDLNKVHEDEAWETFKVRYGNI